MRTAFQCAALLLALQIVSARVGNAGEVVQVKITGLAFSPAEITIREGDTIEWVNGDFIDHTATADDGSWDVVVGESRSARLRFDHAGTTKYFCRFHPDMTGTVHVVAGR
ncbi:blue (type 1) copper domain protein [Hyphomicrobium denitrificans ATCC 51888]|uniref:Blue (Type 1) copper domain protein n=1 Tax=Hyphomicrobium denitrificans (strain ATCC 51888 / DSM 1869 / NCIMB 11706 / TK 0415) TaxID=582899 RepID=D8JRV1_HYPDA|nr:cupredoxin domain-containing protein [Hyphomicrobium denitrificans]ADJ24169.1 blue (type 1) copper domain protein [Hyphomicrobium denitrificans ATCC 51888]